MNELQPLAKFLILGGAVLIILGIALLFWDKIPFLGRLPGDIIIKKKNYTFHFPIVTSIIISLVLSLILYLFRK
ncbi:MAG: DUF2905 domain-containing protein [Ignavibacteriae bacterium HGW-Ignavibacteriae-3]|nr:MAG: DUF2905 domain-containing protein [Ignavibacteriae bacterium HGW-Ignavibacteriae-3]